MRTHIQNAERFEWVRSRRSRQTREKEKAPLLWCFLGFGEEYWHMDEPISREKADLLCRSISLAFSGVKLIVSIASEKLYVIISLSG